MMLGLPLPAWATGIAAKAVGAGITLAVLVGLFVAHGNHRYRAGVADMQPRIAALKRDLGTARANVAQLQAAVNQQNAAVEQAHADGEARLQQARQAAQAAAQRESGRETTRRALEAPGRSTGISVAEWSNL